MTVTHSNYFDVINQIGIKNLPPALKEGHEVIEGIMELDMDWTATGDAELDDTVKVQLQALSRYYQGASAPKATPKQEVKKAQPEKKAKAQVNKVAKPSKPKTPAKAPVKKVASAPKKKASTAKRKTAKTALRKSVSLKKPIKKEPLPGVKIKKYSAELQFIKSYMASRGKNVTANSLKRRIAAIEKVEHTFTDHKTLLNEILSGYKKALNYMSEKNLEALTQGITADFYSRCEAAVKGAVVKVRMDFLGCTDKPKKELGVAHAKPKRVNPIAPSKKRKTGSFLSGVVTSEDIINADYPTIDLGEYAKYFGNVAGNFDMMVFGEPGAGKSYFLISFAGWLSKNLGPALYVSKEEFGARTLSDQIVKTGAANPNLHFSNSLNNVNLKDYDFLFLDSISALKITIEQYRKLREQNPHLAVISIFQKVKDGGFRGGKDWEHEVEIAAEFTKELNDNNEVVGRHMDVYRTRYDVYGIFDM